MMRILLIIFLIFYNIVPVVAETKKDVERDTNTIKETYKLKGQIEYDDNDVETIYLEDNVEKPQINIHQKSFMIPTSILNITSNSNNSRSALSRAMTSMMALTDIMPLSGSVTEYVRGFSYGQTWGQELSYSQMEDTTAFFVRYDFPKYFSITSSVRQSVNQDIGTQYNILRIIPEIRITDRLTLKDSFSTYMNLPKNKNEITLVYTPNLKNYVDALTFEIGFAQSYYDDGRQSSAVSFSTGFKL